VKGAPESAGPDRDHYSYEHYAHRETAEGFDELRFGGPIGRYLLEWQADVLAAALAPLPGRRIVDVGTGTGRAAVGLARGGAAIVGLDYSAEMIRVARARAADAGVHVAYGLADAHRLPLADRSVDAAVSLRLLMHALDWRQCVAELCRVARWRVVIDFPALASVAAIESGARRVARRFGRRTEAYRVIAERDAAAALAQHGFHVAAVRRQFVLPIALHKAVGRANATRAVEGTLAAVGLLRLFGSPVTVVAER